MITKSEIFETLARKARHTRRPEDIRDAMRFGIENRISVAKIRKSLS